ncbi:conserved membrane hypothetical protein [Xenorhabdus bovienii str. kraussei Quebec]|uniref:Major facilitator superfamily (MFS) profile domain-containing protein n=2 Tax=Xenorhabdus bovienii TaxID=40576 RepID=A0A077PC23_XENBV|nr:MFS transporter [Xenorhabdus bovienii]CDH18573.1 conserved membrane hypothetical protein [Xenorhabdus bovienii str. kraussei Quebec]
MSHVDFEKNIFQDKLPLGLLILFTMAVFFVGVTEFMLSSMFPPIAKAFNTSIDKVSLLISGYALSYALAAPILGYFSDKINKVKLLLVALLLFSMDGMAIAFSPTIEVAIFLRILGGIASAVIIPTVFSLVADMVPYKNQAGAMGGIMLGMTIGIAFGPALAGSLNDFIHWRSPFIFCAIGCFIIFFIGYFYFQKYNYQGIITVPLKNNSLKKDINWSVLRPLLAKGAWNGAGVSAFILSGEILHQRYGFPSAITGLSVSFFGLGLGLGNISAGLIRQIIPREEGVLIILNIILSISISIFFLFPLPLWGYFLCLVVWGSALGAGAPISTVVIIKRITYYKTVMLSFAETLNNISIFFLVPPAVMFLSNGNRYLSLVVLGIGLLLGLLLTICDFFIISKDKKPTVSKNNH